MDPLTILGAGVAGLSAAYHAQKAGVDYAIFEAKHKIGGLCRTEHVNGFLFDFSGHLLHLKDSYVLALVLELLKDNIHTVSRNAAIYSHGVFTRYPFQANLYGLPTKVIKECLLKFIRASYENEDLENCQYPNFREWILSKFGEGIGKHFMFPYNEKVWTVPTEALTCEWMGGYVPRPSLEDVIEGAISDCAKAFGYNSSFLYPINGGIQSLANCFVARIAPVRVGMAAVRIDVDKHLITFESGETCQYSHLVSTVPLHRLAHMLEGNVPQDVRGAAKLLMSNTVFVVNVGVRGTGLTDKHWVYIPDKNIPAYRVGVYSNFSDNMTPQGNSSYYVETAFPEAAEISEQHVVETSLDLLMSVGFLRKRADVAVVSTQKIESGYVRFDFHRTNARRTILSFLNSRKISSIGRYGGWDYSGMEEAILQGKEVVNLI